MNHLKEEFRVRRQAVEGFNRLHRAWQFRQFWFRLVGRNPAKLRGLQQLEKTHQVTARHRRGVHSIPLEQIDGSLGRTHDFDAQFRPRTTHTAERWIQVAMAQARDIALPAVQLVRVEDRYYVIDGHHRISVARYMGRLDIDANVEEWSVTPVSSPVCSEAEGCNGAEKHSNTLRRLATGVLQRETWQHVTAIVRRMFIPQRGRISATGAR